MCVRGYLSGVVCESIRNQQTLCHALVGASFLDQDSQHLKYIFIRNSFCIAFKFGGKSTPHLSEENINCTANCIFILVCLSTTIQKP